MSNLFHSTPLINAPLLSSFADKTVKIAGTVKSLGEVAVIDASGDVNVHLAPDAHLQEGHFYEFVGKVNSDLSLKMLSSTQMEFEKEVNTEHLEKLVKLWHQNKEMFY